MKIKKLETFRIFFICKCFSFKKETFHNQLILGFFFFFCEDETSASPPSFCWAPINLMSHRFVSGPTFPPSFTRTSGSTCLDSQQGQLALVQSPLAGVELSLLRVFPSLASLSCCFKNPNRPPAAPSSSPAFIMMRLQNK